MREMNWRALALASALALAGCGGGNPSPASLATVASVNAQAGAPTAPPGGGFKQMVVFGDSLSDDGAYTLAAVQTYGSSVPFAGTLPYAAGGEFTVNGATGNWVDALSASLGVKSTPNIVGYGSASGTVYLTPTGPTTSAAAATCAFNTAAAGAAVSCTDFAQGGSRVSDPNGIGHSGGALTVPVTQQLANYQTQFGSFNANQLITVLAGNNDIFTALSTMSSNVAAGMSSAQALAVAQATVGATADQLAGVVKSIVGAGGKYVLVFTLPDSSLTPFGQTLTGGATCNNRDPALPCFALSNLVQVFNQRLLNDVQGMPVRAVDGYALLNAEIAAPAQFGLTNVSAMWCNPATQSSLLCNAGTPNAAAGAATSNLSTWLFADSVHPTPAGYKIVANSTLSAMRGFGWVAN